MPLLLNFRAVAFTFTWYIDAASIFSTFPENASFSPAGASGAACGHTRDAAAAEHDAELHGADERHRPAGFSARHHLRFPRHFYLVNHCARHWCSALRRCGSPQDSSCGARASGSLTARSEPSRALRRLAWVVSLSLTPLIHPHHTGTTAVAGLALFSGPSSVSSIVQSVADSSMAPLAKFTVAWPLAYHFCGAIRHAIWDIKALGFTNKNMLMSSYAVFGVSTVVSLALATTTLPMNEKKKK